MSRVEEIEQAVQQLNSADLTAFRAWFSEFDAEAWDSEFEEDVASGRLDALAEQAIEDLRQGRCSEL